MAEFINIRLALFNARQVLVKEGFLSCVHTDKAIESGLRTDGGSSSQFGFHENIFQVFLN